MAYSLPNQGQSQQRSYHEMPQPPPPQPHAQSPVDWTTFVNYPTPPVSNAGPVGNNGHMGHYHDTQYMPPQPNQYYMAPPAPSLSGKGKSPVDQNPGQSDAMHYGPMTFDAGLTLDPAAFSRDIRFQIPPFLANPASGVPTFPPGGEAWTGFGQGESSADENLLAVMQAMTSTQSQIPPSIDWSYKDSQHLSNVDEGHRRSEAVSPTNAMATSSLLPQQQYPFGIPSMSTPVPTTIGNVNIASSSSQPYAPPSNTQQLLSGPSLPGGVSSDGPGLYSTTGFDMLGVLARVAARKEPKTVLGPVDFSCSFLVVDVRRFDSPIVYASPTFTALTGYDLPQILGKNCRFLQAPDGEVVKGAKRKYTDNVAVAHLKRMLNAGKECQASLINYRKGGIPFINLVTVVPIPWDGTDIVYHVGFQIDLVEQPNAILRNMRDGSYQVNYTVASPPQAPLRPPKEATTTGLNSDQIEIMGTRTTGEDGKMEWLKLVLENADDFVHVLSLKGLFQYVSPSVRRVLEYEPEELINKNISDICHPSDIVPLMRELKDSTHNDGPHMRTVNLVFRIRRKSSGYVWVECNGRLHVEAGKGRKAVVLSGRAKAVPTLPWDVVTKHGGLAESEFWARISYQGLILHATTGTEMLGIQPEHLVGQSLFGLLPSGENGPPTQVLLDARPSSATALVAIAIRAAMNGDSPSGAMPLRHKMLKRDGSVVDVLTMFYAYHALSGGSPNSEGSKDTSSSMSGVKPTSLVIQVKLVASPSELGNTPASVAAATNARPVIHPAATNLFEELETTRGTSWQYELHQLRVQNRRIKDEISAALAKVASRKGRKRKSGEGGPPSLPLPEQYNAPPRHQLAPGFGLVPAGMPSFY